MILTSHRMHRVLYSFCFILSCLLDQTHGQTVAQVNTVSTNVLTGYNKQTRPTDDQTTAVTVNVHLFLIALRDFNEVLGKLSTALLFQMSWKDDSLVWDPSMNNNVNSLSISQDSVWKPLLTLSNAYDQLRELGDKDWVTVQVESTGQVSWFPLAQLETTCSITTEYYPFDKQSCKMEMYPFGYNDEEITINITSSTLDLEYYEGNSLWKITSTSVTSVLRVPTVSFLTVTINLERQPTFIIVNFLIPIFFLAFLNPLVFVLPTESGERIGYSITILLSLSVFMTILGDFIPPNASPMSLCAFMLMTLYVCSSFILALVIVSVKIYNTSDKKPVSPFLEKFVKFCSLQCRRGTKVNTKKDEENVKELQPQDNNREELDTEDQIVTWKDVSEAIDKCSLVGMYMVIILAASVFVGVIRHSS